MTGRVVRSVAVAVVVLAVSFLGADPAPAVVTEELGTAIVAPPFDEGRTSTSCESPDICVAEADVAGRIEATAIVASLWGMSTADALLEVSHPLEAGVTRVDYRINYVLEKFAHLGGQLEVTAYAGCVGCETAGWRQSFLVAPVHPLADLSIVSDGRAKTANILVGIHAWGWNQYAPCGDCPQYFYSGASAALRILSITATMHREPMPPAPPEGLEASPVDPRHIRVAWSPPASSDRPVTGYAVYRSTADGGRQLLATTPAETRSFTHAGLRPGDRVDYLVAARSELGEGPAAGPVTATTPTTVPEQVQDLTAEPFRHRGKDRGIVLRWSPPVDGGSPITECRVVRWTAGSSLVALASVPASATSFEDRSVTAGVTYSYAVSAVNANGEGPASEPAEATARP